MSVCVAKGLSYCLSNEAIGTISTLQGKRSGFQGFLNLKRNHARAGAGGVGGELREH